MTVTRALITLTLAIILTGCASAARPVMVPSISLTPVVSTATTATATAG